MRPRYFILTTAASSLLESWPICSSWTATLPRTFPPWTISIPSGAEARRWPTADGSSPVGLRSRRSLPDALRSRNNTIETIKQRHRNAALGRLLQGITQCLVNLERASRKQILQRRQTMLRRARFEHATCPYDHLHGTFLSAKAKARGREVRLIRQFDSERLSQTAHFTREPHQHQRRVRIGHIAPGHRAGHHRQREHTHPRYEL